jgi:hypothetical protein
MPFIWGSACWDVAITERRFLAVQWLIAPFLSPSGSRIESLPWSDVQSCEFHLQSKWGNAMLSLATPRATRRYKMLYMGYDYFGAERALRQSFPGLTAQPP